MGMGGVHSLIFVKFRFVQCNTTVPGGCGREPCPPPAAPFWEFLYPPLEFKCTMYLT